MNALRTVTVMVMIGVVLAGCRTWPDDSAPLEPPLAEGSYVGSGTLGGGATNVLMAINGPDTSGHLDGAIRYRAQIIDLEEIYRVQDNDTVWFRYHRDDVTHRAWALLGGNGLAVQFVEPTGIPVFRLNREISGYNMSGTWRGLMSSTALQIQSEAALTMDQQGQSFYGTAETVFVQSARFELNNGVANESSFHLTGTLYEGTASASALMVGAYLARDTLAGNWDAGENGSVDRGEFWFCRSFD